MFNKMRKVVAFIGNVFIFTAIIALLGLQRTPIEAQQGGGPIYGSQSHFNQLIPTNATYELENRIGTFRHNWEEWSMPIYRLDPDEDPPLVTVINNYSGRTEHWPIPTYAIPASADDHHLGVMVPHENIIYEMWDAQWENSTTIRAGGMTSFPLDGTGISDPPNHRVVAAGFAVSGGMVIREDFTNPATGELDSSLMLNHALSMSLPFDLVASGEYVSPAVGGETLGRAGPEGVPMGARFAVPADLDIDSLNVHPFTKQLLYAARDYGIYVNDTNGAPQYNGKFVGSIRVEPGLMEELYGTSSDDLVSTVQSEIFGVVQQYGIYRVTTDGSPPPTPTTPPPTTTTPPPTTTTPTPDPSETPTVTPTPTEPPSSNATNVILIIGDGMGFEHVEAAGYFANGEKGLFNFEQFPYVGEMTTNMADDDWTDSAASATAMATGIKVTDGVVSVAIPGSGADLQTIIEYLNMQGISTGMITTGHASTATTAAFAAHNQSRENYDPIAADILQTRPTIFFSGDNDWMTPQTASAAGYTVVDSRAEMLALNTESATYVSGQFGSWSMPYVYDGYPSDLPHLSEMTTTALNILDNNPNGFFIVIEENNIDDAAHDNDIQRNVNETIELADTVQAALNWAAGRNDTLILVTADHETGGLNVLQNNGQGNYPTVEWERTTHSSRHVPVYAWGAGADQINGVIDNTDIYRLSRGWEPASVGGVTITPTNLNIAQNSGTGTYSVVLRSQPSDIVDINFDIEGAVSVNRNRLRFTTSNWNVPQTVTVTANGNGIISHLTESDDITYEGIYLIDDVTVTVGATIVDGDGDGLSDDDENNLYNTNPNNPDTDGDSLNDGDEVLVYTTDPLSTDTDTDLLNDGDEVNVYGTNPLVFDNRLIAGYTWLDANGDGIQDGGEAEFGGVQVNLYQSNSILYESMITGSDGLYSFDLMPPDDYYLEFGVPNGYGLSPQDVNADDTLDSDPNRDTGIVATFALGPSDEQEDWDAGFVEAGVSVDPTALEIAEGGGTATYTIVLNTQPQDDVQVFLSPDAQITINSISFTFTPSNWATPQQVEVAAVDDDVIEGEHFGIISHVVSSFDDVVYNNMVISSVTITIADNDEANNPPIIAVAMDSVDIPEGQTASNDGTVSDPDGDNLTLTASIGNVVENNGVWSWTWETDDGPTENQTVTITVEDDEGESSQTTFDLVVENISPVATFFNDTGAITVGGAVTLTFTDQADPSLADTTTGFTYSYDCDNDSNFELENSPDAGVMCAYNTSGSFTARGRIADKDGGFNDYTASVVVNDEGNTIPIIGIDQTVRNVGEGQTAANTGTASDDDGDALILTASVGTVVDNNNGTWSWSWETSDGPAESQTVTINVEDDNGGSNQVGFELTVNNVVPIADFTNTSGTINVDETAIVQFTNQIDPSSVDMSEGFEYSYDCTNDGVFDVEDSNDASVTCTYQSSGTFTVLGRIADKDGGFNDYTAVVLVEEIINNPPDLIVDQMDVGTAEGQTVFNTGLINDPDNDDLVLTASIGVIIDNNDGTWSWSWGTSDGPSESQTVTVEADDGKGGVEQATFEVAVINVAPTADFVNVSDEIIVGDGANLVFSNQFDPSFADAISGFYYSYDCDSDGVFELFASDQSAAICTYLDVGTYTALGRIADKDGDYNDYTTTVTVKEVPPIEPVDIDSFVFLAEEGVWFQSDSTLVSGNVGVNTVSDGPFLRNNSEITLDRSVNFQSLDSQLMGDTIRLGRRVEVYDTYYNELNGSGEVLGDHFTPLGFPLVSGYPTIPEFSAGNDDLFASSGDVLTIHTGDYGTLRTSRNATIVFTGGVYNFQSWNLQRGVRVYFAAPTEIRIAGQLRANRNTYIGPDPAAIDVDAAHIVFYVMGQNGDDGEINESPKAAQFGSNTTLVANMIVPNGTLRIHNDTHAIGAYLGRWIIIGKRTQTSLSSAFGGPIDFSDYGVTPETPTPTESPTVVVTETPTPDVTATPTPDVTESPTPTESPTVVVTETPSVTVSPTPDVTESPTPDPTDPPVDYTVPAECIGIVFSGQPIFGTERSDNITGTEGNDLIFGLGGHDEIYGRGGDDCIIGGSGADFIVAGFGNDVLYGGDDDDTLIGNEGEDRIFGEDGADNLFGGDDDDDLQGGDDSDEIFGGDGDDVIDGGDDSDAPLAGDGGNDTIHGGKGHDVLYGDEDIHNDSNNHFNYDLIGEIGEPGDDILYGDEGHDAIYGGDGNDWIDGGNDGDNLFGNNGNDTIIGGPGSDGFRGGNGTDQVTDYSNIDGMCREVEQGCGRNELPDDDNDGVDNASDVCPGFDDNQDTDGDGTPDGCDTTPTGDSDNDGVDNASDVCPGFDDTQDTDGDGTPNGCDVTPNGDSDSDGVDNASDICPGFDDNQDTDGDGTPDGCDTTSTGDSDNDGVDNASDICPGFDDTQDTDGDGTPNGCDTTPTGDNDSDGVDNASDVCPGFDDNQDTDGDGTPDGCDTTPNGDRDEDGIGNLVDNCPDTPNPDQVDSDGNGQGDVCTI